MQATRTVYISLQAMELRWRPGGHGWLNQRPAQKPPYPRSETSVASCMCGARVQWLCRSRLVPGQVGRNWSHQWRSALASLLGVMWWCRRETVVERSMSRRMKMRPGGTTLHAKASLPMRESKDRLVQVWCRCAFGRGRGEIGAVHPSWSERWSPTESSSIPRKVSVVAGPSVFSCFRGALTLAQRSVMRVMFCWQTVECGGPAVKKSSK